MQESFWLSEFLRSISSFLLYILSSLLPPMCFHQVGKLEMTGKYSGFQALNRIINKQMRKTSTTRLNLEFSSFILPLKYLQICCKNILCGFRAIKNICNRMDACQIVWANSIYTIILWKICIEEGLHQYNGNELHQYNAMRLICTIILKMIYSIIWEIKYQYNRNVWHQHNYSISIPSAIT